MKRMERRNDAKMKRRSFVLFSYPHLHHLLVDVDVDVFVRMENQKKRERMFLTFFLLSLAYFEQ